MFLILRTAICIAVLVHLVGCNRTAEKTSATAPVKEASDDVVSSDLLQFNSPLKQADLALLTSFTGSTLQIDAGLDNQLAIADWAESLPPQLTHLRIRKHQIDSGEFESIVKRCNRLEILNLPDCQVTAQNQSLLRDLSRIRQLRLGGDCWTDSLMDHLVDLGSLRSIHLIGPSLTGDGLRKMGNLTRVRTFYLDDCEIEQSAWDELIDSRPDIHIHIDQAHPDRK